MERRSFLKKAGATGVAAAVVSAPALAADGPTVRWRLASSFPKSLDTIYGAAEQLSKRVAELTGGKFQIRVFPGGEIAPGNQVLDVVQNGTVECGHTASYYYVGKNKAFAFDTSLPFGLTARQQNAWLYYGGGMKAMRELFAQYNIVNFPGGNTGCQMGGWFRNEVKDLAGLKGLKMRIPGFGGEIMAKLGAIPQSIPGGDIYPALEKGTIDATEWVGPYDDEKLGFYKVAKFYYYPGFWEPGPNLSFYVNSKEWAKLPKEYQQAFEVASAEANLLMLAEYDAKNPQALVSLLQKGVKLKKYPADIMKAAHTEAFKLYEEEAAKNPAFAKIYGPWKKFRAMEHGWFNLAELGMESFMYSNKK
ncbi:TRAP transporter substrate-binding protein [Craterilacuibacter sp. RT1T]|uniref:TRAP transporter substrate-binding protein n=1 Tax=Craterilacuibacter sp. RT1T TaxID=2942211 RepID=UPI0020BE2754|nr:TRAP transporter substrate-binding protein [Craterilacuibacter sp. RT1T]MCL6263105.1 TRAP transporter substrate-binding protein [Craterilacuibacter sp. RT1T]